MFGLGKKIVSGRELRGLVRDEILLACDFRRGVGRPRQGVLGAERTQMCTSVAVQITTALIDKLAGDGCVLESTLDTMHTAGGRHVFARDMLLKLVQGRRNVVSAVPEEAFFNTLGDIIRVGKGKREGMRRAEMQYVGKLGATVIELTAAWNVTRKAKAEADARFSVPNDLYASVVPNMPAGITLEDYTAQALNAYNSTLPPASAGQRKR